ncbi:MAG: flagellar hook-length control protein FliK [Selenomonadaceae bacterium]|nr:flagellar hook-length control protein FliK [Selenomonadaceae bacterium]
MNNNVSVMSVQTKADTKVSAGKTVTAGSKSKVEDFSQTFQEAKQEKGVKSDFKSNAKSETAGSAAEKAAELQEAAVKDAVNAVSDGTVKDSAAEDVPAENINTDTKGTVLEAGQLLTAMVMGVMAQPVQQNVQNIQMADGEKVAAPEGLLPQVEQTEEVPMQNTQQQEMPQEEASQLVMNLQKAEAVQELQPVNKQDVLANTAASKQTEVDNSQLVKNPDSINALLQGQNNGKAPVNPHPDTTSKQQMLEVLSSKGGYDARLYVKTEQPANQENITMQQLNEALGNVEVVQGRNTADEAGQNLQQNLAQEQQSFASMINADGSEVTQLPEEAAFDVAPIDQQNANNAAAAMNTTVGSVNDARPEAVQQPQAVNQPAADYDVPKQIVEQARLIQNGQNSEMVIKLNPEHLGELHLKVSVNGNGGVTATFHTDNAQVKAILESSMVQLKQQLSEQGMKVDSVEVQTGLPDGQLPQGQSQGYYQQQQQGQAVHSTEADMRAFEETSGEMSATGEYVNRSTESVRDGEGNVITDGVDYAV